MGGAGHGAGGAGLRLRGGGGGGEPGSVPARPAGGGRSAGRGGAAGAARAGGGGPHLPADRRGAAGPGARRAGRGPGVRDGLRLDGGHVPGAGRRREGAVAGRGGHRRGHGAARGGQSGLLRGPGPARGDPVGGGRADDGTIASVAADAWSAPGAGFLAGVATAAAHRGSGHAATVCRFVVNALLAEHGRVALMVDSWNHAAIGVYERLGMRRRRVAAAYVP
ncbi:GNAT family N-acetyltransferase [Sphaerisporangium fuscum]|uniref:GNAT family N-acetyltransferase n=1 Tax=Sphaerisporangium fuscum TaxID=2835868 RepID=UPI0027E3500F|nr:GNAT family N-acetyltransferase [Sphaerisporangium fuscum]